MAFERYKILRWYESEDTVFLLVDIKALVHDTGRWHCGIFGVMCSRIVRGAMPLHCMLTLAMTATTSGCS